MKKAISLILISVLCLSLMAGCCLSHDWAEADCVNPKTCAECGKTEGEALGHDWVEADCVTPKTCAKCGETEGEALGHDWAEADCLTPKTCGRCDETEGEALGHSYSGWEVKGTDKMVNSCAACGDTMEDALDREVIGLQQYIGTWELTSVTVGDSWFDLHFDWTLEFFEDKTFVLHLNETISGELEFVEFYDGEHMDFYVFDGHADKGRYNFNYDPVEDVLFIIGGQYYRFERVE